MGLGAVSVLRRIKRSCALQLRSARAARSRVPDRLDVVLAARSVGELHLMFFAGEMHTAAGDLDDLLVEINGQVTVRIRRRPTQARGAKVPRIAAPPSTSAARSCSMRILRLIAPIAPRPRASSLGIRRQRCHHSPPSPISAASGFASMRKAVIARLSSPAIAHEQLVIDLLASRLVDANREICTGRHRRCSRKGEPGFARRLRESQPGNGRASDRSRRRAWAVRLSKRPAVSQRARFFGCGT